MSAVTVSPLTVRVSMAADTFLNHWVGGLNAFIDSPYDGAS
jgi:hypothetical protein